jgi:hypothetical protein
MGENELRTGADNEADASVEDIRGRANQIDARRALQNVLDILKNTPNYFKWINASGDDDPDVVPSWILRVPKKDGEMKDEEVQIVHICRPVLMWEAVAEKDPERTVAHTGYVKEGACLRCKLAAPEKLNKQFGNLIKLISLGKDIS